MKKNWTGEDLLFLQTHYPNKPTSWLSKEMDRSVRSIYAMANLHEIKKTQEFLNSEQSGRLTPGRVIGYNTQFKKGKAPINKGKKQIEFMSAEAIERTKNTRFKKGFQPHNHKPIGWQRITVDGYTEVKTKEPNTFELKHRLEYQKHHNVVLKKSDVIRFKDGNKQNFAIENLILVSRYNHLVINQESDSSIAKKISNKDEALAAELLKHPELINLKRKQLSLTKQIKQHGKRKQNG